MRLVLAPVAALACLAWIPWVRANPRLLGSFGGAVAGLLLLWLVVHRRVARSGRVLSYEVSPRPVHYVQLAMHSSIYVYWGWYWREVYHYIPLIAAQIAFVYALDMLVCWWRQDRWVLGFGPVPIVLSTNLFLWFKDDWFFLQFLLVSTGVVCKSLLTWKRDGRRTHIFNPSAIGLALFSLGLLVTHSTHISWAEEVAVTLGRPPNIYIEIFVLGLIVQALFSVTLVTLSAAAMLFVLNLGYTQATGVYYFVDSNIPAAVFLGLHLLVTDPATSPRGSPGKIVFGAMYGAAVFALYALLGALGAPTFYDKLLCVPPLNLTVRMLDRMPTPRWAPAWTPRRANLAHMAVWAALFATMAGTGFVGGRHPGAQSEFWRRACVEGRHNACDTWLRTSTIACQHGAGKECLSLATALSEGRLVSATPAEAAKDYARACDLSVPGGCAGLVSFVRARGPEALEKACGSGDGESCFVLASLLFGGGGVARDYQHAADLFRRACDDRWWRGCGGLAECFRAGRGVTADAAQSVAYFEKACRGGVAVSCYSVAGLYRQMRSEALARERFQQACALSTRYATANAAYFAPGVQTAAPAFCAQSSQ